MTKTDDLLNIRPQDFVDFLKSKNIARFYFVYDAQTQRVNASHKILQPIADFIQSDTRDFMKHEGMFFQRTRKYDTLQGAFIHRTNRGQGAGGVRYWHYNTVEEYLRDGLRLAKGMTRKNALAGLWWGGGKGVMAHNPAYDKEDPEVRQAIYQEYGELMTSIRGCYVTAEDVGTNVEDMVNIFSKTRFTTCIPASFGGSGNPSFPTARGVICGMEAALTFAGHGTLENKTVAVQGVGNVGAPLVGYLFEKGVAKIVASDVSEVRVNRLQSQFRDKNLEIKAVVDNDASVLEAECDVLAPCATGAVLNARTIPKIKAKVVCGAANNQLEDSSRDDLLLHERGIIYVPDFLTNRMGIVNCANEQYGNITHDPQFEKHLSRDWEYSIYQTALRVLKESRETGDPPAKVATRQADELSLQLHPIFGHRGYQIIRSLVNDRWQDEHASLPLKN